MKLIQLTEREEQVMDFMWEYGKPVTSKEILEFCKDRTWKDSYLLTMLHSLEVKGAIKRCGRVLYGTQYARLLKPAITKEQYYIQLAYKRGVDRMDFVQLAVCHDLDPDSTDKMIEMLNGLIKDLEKKNEE